MNYRLSQYDYLIFKILILIYKFVGECTVKIHAEKICHGFSHHEKKY